MVAYLIVWPLSAAGLRGEEVEPLGLGEYLYVLVFAAIAWPFYIALVAALSRRRRFRLWAIVASPLLGVLLNVGLLFVNVPEILAGWVFYLLYGSTVRPR